MIKENCPHLCEVISKGEKVKACRQDEYTVNTYFSCENCKRDKKDNENKSTAEDDMKKLCNKEIVKDFIGKYDTIYIESKNGIALCDNLGNCHTDEIDFNSAKGYKVINKRIASNSVVLTINFISDK